MARLSKGFLRLTPDNDNAMRGRGRATTRERQDQTEKGMHA